MESKAPILLMTPGPSTPDGIRQGAETVGRLLRWIAELWHRRDWFMLLVVMGVMLATLGGMLREPINQRLPEAAKGPFWASLITGVALFFLGALIVAVVTMPHPGPVAEGDIVEHRVIKGLRPFDRKDASIFARLQRQGSLRECCEAVTSDAYKFGILMGESGCGKTSFLQAGLWSKLTAPESSHRAIYVRFSDQEPIETVRQALAEQLEIPLDWLGACAFSQLLTQAMEAAEAHRAPVRPVRAIFCSSSAQRGAGSLRPGADGLVSRYTVRWGQSAGLGAGGSAPRTPRITENVALHVGTARSDQIRAVFA